MSNFARVSAGFVLAMRSALYGTGFVRIDEIGIFVRKMEVIRTVCKGLTPPFEALTGDALLTVMTTEGPAHRFCLCGQQAPSDQNDKKLRSCSVTGRRKRAWYGVGGNNSEEPIGIFGGPFDPICSHTWSPPPDNDGHTSLSPDSSFLLIKHYFSCISVSRRSNFRSMTAPSGIRCRLPNLSQPSALRS